MTGAQIREAIADVASRARLPELAAALGLAVAPKGFACPACAAERRHQKRGDKRGAAGLTPNGKGWRCHQCDASGDALNLIAYAIGDAPFKKLDRERQRQVLAWAGDHGLCQPLEGPAVVLPARPAPSPPAPPKRPPAGEVAALWHACRSVETDPAVAAYLRLRGLDPWLVVARSLAEAIPTGIALPGWAGTVRGPWNRTGYRLAFRLVDATGEMQSIHVRSVDPAERLKALSPTGFEIAGLVLADLHGLCMLRETWAPPEVWIVEGPIDFMTVGTWEIARRDCPAIFGVLSGSWTEDFAARVPDRTKVRIMTHADEAGEKYARGIADTFTSRAVNVVRNSPAAASPVETASV